MEFKTEHLKDIDIVKGIAIFLVVLGHAVQGIVSSNHITFFTQDASILVAKEVIYSFHMPLFFMVAGIFLEQWLKKPFITGIKKKAWRLLYPYFVWGAIIASVMELAKGYTNNGLGLINFFYSPIIPFSQYWFLYVLFFLHLLVSIVSHMRVTAGNSLNVLVFGAMALYVGGVVLPSWWILPVIGKFMIFFVLGRPLYSFITKAYFRYNVLWSCLLGFIIMTIGYIFSLAYESHEISYYLFFLTSLLGSMTVFLLAKKLAQKDNRVTKVLVIWGKHSMEIYCMHLLFLAGCRIFLMKIMKMDDLWLITVVITVVAMFCCHMAVHILDKQGGLKRILFG